MEVELGFLSEAERKVILEVLKRDEDLRQMENTRLKRLQKEFRLLKRKGVKKSKGRTCARCQKALGLVINSGDPCRQCRHVVCGACRVLAAPPNKAWTCTVCHKEAIYKVETGQWFVEEKAKKFGQALELPAEIVRKSMKKRPGSKREPPAEVTKRIRDQVESGTSPPNLARIPEEPGARDEQWSDAVSNSSTVDSRPECSRQASRMSRTSGRSQPAQRSAGDASGRPSPVPSYVGVPPSRAAPLQPGRESAGGRESVGGRESSAGRESAAGRESSAGRESVGGRESMGGRESVGGRESAGPRGTKAGKAQRPPSRDSGAVSPARSKYSVASSGGKFSKSAGEEDDEEEEAEVELRDDAGQQQESDYAGDYAGDEVDYEEGDEEYERADGRTSVSEMFGKCSKNSKRPGMSTSVLDLRPDSAASGGVGGMGARCVSVPAVNMDRGMEEDEEEDIDRIVTSHRGSTSVTGTMRSTMSMASLFSTYSEVDFGGVEVRGDVLLSLQYEFRTGCLNVHVFKARNLAYGNDKKKTCNPYVKIYLLPDKSKQSKRKTSVQKNNINPVFNETLKYTMSQSQLSTRTLQLSVWHHDALGRNAFLGETEINMDTWNLDNTKEQWMPLQQRSKAKPGGIAPYNGELVLALKFVPAHLIVAEKPAVESRLKRTLRRKPENPQLPGGEIHVQLKEARNLCPLKPGGTVNSFVKASMLPIDPKLSRVKTAVVKQKVNPTWNETLVLRGVQDGDLRRRGLELTVWDKESIASKHFLGGVRLGAGPPDGEPVTQDWQDSRGEEVMVWEQMCDIHNTWVEACLLLRPDMARQ